MHVFFKPVIFLFALACIFYYIFVNSNTLEITTEVYTNASGMVSQRTVYIYHWDRFGDYIKNTPERVKKALGGS